MIMNEAELEFSLVTGKTVLLKIADGVFIPNITSNLLISAALKLIDKPKKILDLGCGSGVVGLAISLEGFADAPLCASDLSAPSVICTEENYLRYRVVSDVRNGSLFEPWEGHKFDLIIDDISGIAKQVAEISPWFKGVPCDSGDDGCGLVNQIIRSSKNYLEINGVLIFPVLSLSNVKSILKEANDNFANIRMIARQEWPLPNELKNKMPQLRELKQQGLINFEEKFGMVLCYTEIYAAIN